LAVSLAPCSSTWRTSTPSSISRCTHKSRVGAMRPAATSLPAGCAPPLLCQPLSSLNLWLFCTSLHVCLSRLCPLSRCPSPV
jgi:hypothetical protein